MHLRMLLILSVISWNITLGAESKKEWQTAVETLERKSIKSLQPVNELLLNELTEQQKLAQTKNDQAKLAQLEPLLTQAHARKERLGQGLMWIPQKQEAAWQNFCRENYGKKWQLNGTQNVRYFRIENRGLITINSKGEEFFKQHLPSVIPGVFVSHRTDRGASIYLVSPDSKQALCLVTQKFHEQESAELPPTRVQDIKDSVKTPTSTDLLEMLTTEVQVAELHHAIDLYQLLDTHYHKLLSGRSRDVIQLHQKKIETRETLHYLQGSPLFPVQTASKDTFQRAAKNKTWFFPASRTHRNLDFDGQNLRITNAVGAEPVSVPTSIVWPGLFMMKPSTGENPSYLLTSPDLRHAMLIPNTTMRFSGALAE